VTLSSNAGLAYEAMIGQFISHLIIGTIAGYLGGLVIVSVINRLQFDPRLFPLISLALALFVFAAAGKLHGSGYLAVYIAGLVAGNSRLKNSHNVRQFHEGVSWLGQITMFIILGLLGKPLQFLDYFWPAFVIAFALTFVARPLAAFICLYPFKFSPAESAFVGWVGLRGAISILLALLPVIHQLPNAEQIFTITFLVVILSLIMQGWTIKPVAYLLKLIVPPKAGAVDRLEVDLPMDQHMELVAYRVQEGSPIIRGESLPAWIRPALILRNGKPLNIADTNNFQPDDHIYLFIDPARLSVLDRLFGAPLEDPHDEADFFGKRVVDPTVPIGNILEHSLIRKNGYDPGMSIADIFQTEFSGSFEIGDRLRLGPFRLIIKSIEQGKITDIGLLARPQSFLDRLRIGLR
jgi:potassium/hydrogen antiporter